MNFSEKINMRVLSINPSHLLKILIIIILLYHIEALKNVLSQMTQLEVFLDIKEVRKPEVEAKLVADNISTSLNSNLMLATPEKMKKLKDIGLDVEPGSEN